MAAFTPLNSLRNHRKAFVQHPCQDVAHGRGNPVIAGLCEQPQRADQTSNASIYTDAIHRILIQIDLGSWILVVV